MQAAVFYRKLRMRLFYACTYTHSNPHAEAKTPYLLLTFSLQVAIFHGGYFIFAIMKAKIHCETNQPATTGTF